MALRRALRRPLGLLVFIWASRLGSFLFRRVRSVGSDPRFDEIKPSASRFLVAWTLQGLWVFLTLCAALAAITTVTRAPLGLLDAFGIGVWLIGFTIEVVFPGERPHRTPILEPR